MKRIILSVLIVLFLFGCKTADKGQPVFNNTDPVALCNYILTVFHSCDVDGIAKTFNKANREKFLPLNEDNRKKIAQFCKEEARTIQGVSAISELRNGPSFMGKGSVVGKIKVTGNEVFVIVLTKEGDSYAFEDINSPSIRMYNSLKLIRSW